MSPDETPPSKTSWPARPYLLTLLISYFIMIVTGPTMSGSPGPNQARFVTQTGIYLILLGRYLWAERQREQNNTWRVYVAGMILATLFWHDAEKALMALWYRFS